MPSETSPQSGALTGVWNGSYGYDNILGVPDNAFVAILIESGGSLSGTTHETLGLPDGSVHDANATLRGDHQGDEVDFVKTYGDALRTSAITSESVCSCLPCVGMTRVGWIPWRGWHCY